MDFYGLIELSQIRAIQLAIEPSLESIWRIRCRQYSTLFHTPLHVVMNDLDPLMVLQALYENQYPPSVVGEELEDLLDILNKIKDPSYSRMSEEETESLVDNVLNREIARASKKKAPTQQTIEAAIKSDAIRPKSGGMNFSQLENIEAKAETNKAGFDQ